MLICRVAPDIQCPESIVPDIVTGYFGSAILLTSNFGSADLLTGYFASANLLTGYFASVNLLTGYPANSLAFIRSNPNIVLFCIGSDTRGLGLRNICDVLQIKTSTIPTLHGVPFIVSDFSKSYQYGHWTHVEASCYTLCPLSTSCVKFRELGLRIMKNWRPMRLLLYQGISKIMI